MTTVNHFLNIIVTTGFFFFIFSVLVTPTDVDDIDKVWEQGCIMSDSQHINFTVVIGLRLTQITDLVVWEQGYL